MALVTGTRGPDRETVIASRLAGNHADIGQIGKVLRFEFVIGGAF
jgi:hypothetical protein